MPPRLRLIHPDPPAAAPIIADGDDDEDGTLGGLFLALNTEIHRILAEGRGAATERSLGPVLLRLANLAEDYYGVPTPPPADRT